MRHQSLSPSGFPWQASCRRLSSWPLAAVDGLDYIKRPTFRKALPMQAVLYVLLQILDLYMYILIASAIFSWLFAFNIVNPRNQVVGVIGSFLYTMTEPLLRPIRRYMPNTGGLDLSFLVLWFGIILLQQIIIRYIFPYVF